jgi:IclR helix-turn-helix domain
VNPSQQVGRVLDELNSSVWAFAALPAALEAGLLELLAEPQGLGAISAQLGLDLSLAEGMLDVLVALGLVRRDGQVVVAVPELAPLLAPDAREVLLAQLRSEAFDLAHVAQVFIPNGSVAALGCRGDDAQFDQVPELLGGHPGAVS